jgi:hypothetical protein
MHEKNHRLYLTSNSDRQHIHSSIKCFYSMYFNEYDLVTHQIISSCRGSLEENSFKTTFDICSTAMIMVPIC